MLNSYIKRCSLSSFIRKITINMAMRYHRIPTRKTKIQKDDKNMI